MLSFKDIETSNTISGIPPYHYDSHLHNFENRYKHKDTSGLFFKSLYDLTVKILDFKSTSNYVFLCGSPGCGKTHYMVGLYRALVAKLGYSQGEGTLFTTFSGLSAEIISLFKEDMPLRVGIQGYVQSKWLFLDDFTASERVLKENSLEFNMLRDILLDRYEKGYMAILSCNMRSVELMQEVDKLFGAYVTSRVSSNSDILQFPALDFREKK